VKGTNPCVTGDTYILTDEGNIQIANLVGKKVKVWNGEEFSETEPFSTGVNNIYEVQFSNAVTVKCTDYHEFPVVRDGEVIRVMAKNLSDGELLEPFKLYEDGENSKFYNLRITSVTNLRRTEETFCFTEPKRHLGTFNGVVLGQCGEQSMADHNNCTLTVLGASFG
jgi:hypothetical protein